MFFALFSLELLQDLDLHALKAFSKDLSYVSVEEVVLQINQ